MQHPTNLKSEYMEHHVFVKKNIKRSDTILRVFEDYRDSDPIATGKTMKKKVVLRT